MDMLQFIQYVLVQSSKVVRFAQLIYARGSYLITWSREALKNLLIIFSLGAFNFFIVNTYGENKSTYRANWRQTLEACCTWYLMDQGNCWHFQAA